MLGNQNAYLWRKRVVIEGDVGRERELEKRKYAQNWAVLDSFMHEQIDVLMLYHVISDFKLSAWIDKYI